MRAGLAAARGDAVIFLDASAQHLLSLVPRMIRRWNGGAELICVSTQGLAGRTELKCFDSNVLVGLKASQRRSGQSADFGDLTLLSRRVIDHLGV